MPAVDARRTGALLAGASGVLLIASLFLPWFGLDLRVELPGDGATINAEQARLTGWEEFGGLGPVALLPGLRLVGRDAAALLARLLGPSPHLCSGSLHTYPGWDSNPQALSGNRF